MAYAQKRKLPKKKRSAEKSEKLTVDTEEKMPIEPIDGIPVATKNIPVTETESDGAASEDDSDDTDDMETKSDAEEKMDEEDVEEAAADAKSADDDDAEAQNDLSSIYGIDDDGPVDMTKLDQKHGRRRWIIGVLAIVALRLGATHVLGTDIDPLAVRVAAENAALNAVSTGADGQLELRKESVPADATGKYPVVVANILAEVLAKLFDGEYGNTPLADPLAPGGTIILSGILEDRAALVEAAAMRHGLSIVGRYQEGDWVAIVARSSPA